MWERFSTARMVRKSHFNSVYFLKFWQSLFVHAFCSISVPFDPGSLDDLIAHADFAKPEGASPFSPEWKIMEKQKLKPKLKLKVPGNNGESDPPNPEEYGWLNKENAKGGPSNPEAIPEGFKDASELDAISWVRKNCKFASRNDAQRAC